MSVYPRYFLLLKNHSDLEEKQRCNTAGGSILKFMKPNTASKSKDNSINVSSINETSPMLEDINITNNATVNLTVENQENKVQNQTENSAVDLEGMFYKSYPEIQELISKFYIF